MIEENEFEFDEDENEFVQTGFIDTYALHRSTKQDGFLQLSCMELKNGQIIPTSDRQYNASDGGFSGFFRDLPRSVDVYFLEQ